MPSLPKQVALSELNDPLSGTLCHELRKASVAVTAAVSGEFAQWNLKPSEAALLKYVGANPGCTQSEIARAYRNKATNLVSLIARLERDGLVERVRGEGRAIALSISAKGKDVLIKVDAGFQRLEDRLGEKLTMDQRSVFIDALRVICSAACHYGMS